jgi:hypothetical protein
VSLQKRSDADIVRLWAKEKQLHAVLVGGYPLLQLGFGNFLLVGKILW